MLFLLRPVTVSWLHVCVSHCRADDNRWPGSGRCRQEDLLDGHGNQPHRGRQPGRLHEESSGLAKPGQPSSHRPLPWDGVRLLKRDSFQHSLRIVIKETCYPRTMFCWEKESSLSLRPMIVLELGFRLLSKLHVLHSLVSGPSMSLPSQSPTFTLLTLSDLPSVSLTSPVIYTGQTGASTLSWSAQRWMDQTVWSSSVTTWAGPTAWPSTWPAHSYCGPTLTPRSVMTPNDRHTKFHLTSNK